MNTTKAKTNPNASENTMNNKEIADVLNINPDARTETQTKAARTAMRKIAFSLSKRAFRLMSLVSSETRGAVRVAGTDTFKVTVNGSHKGRKVVHPFTNADLRVLISRELVVASCVGGGVGRLEATTVGRYVPLHRY